MTLALLWTGLAHAASGCCADGAVPASVPGIDAPQWARLGPLPVGVRTLSLVDLLAAAAGRMPTHHDRILLVDLWYPARVPAHAVAERYLAQLPAEPPAAPTGFEIAGLAIRNAPVQSGRYPLVIVSHGFSNPTVALSWLTENLASKGYVVAAIRHADAPITDRAALPQLLLRRPLDIAFVARALQRSLGADGLVDAERTALIGYSMGAYGVLTAAGATLDPLGVACQAVPGGALLPYARGGARLGEMRVQPLKAVVAMALFGGAQETWGAEGMAALTTPLLLIHGDQDHTAAYAPNSRVLLDGALHAPRYLLTFLNAGHALGLAPVPQAMRSTLWDLSWFEDPVWRKDRIVAINLHFITAFLDRYVKGDESRASFLDGLVPRSSEGKWEAPAGTDYDAYSPGGEGVTLWKGFQRHRADGLEFERREPLAP
jgi:predicted dienelactone hydrolase